MTYTVMNPKYPEIEIKLVGEDGNAFSILGRVRRAFDRSSVFAEWSDEDAEAEWENYYAEATSGDYDNLLATTMRWFSCS